MINRQPELPPRRGLTSIWLIAVLAVLVVAGLTASANGQSGGDNSGATSPIRATHVLGFEDVRRNVSGQLSIEDEQLRFQRDGTAGAKVTINSIQNISLGEQDRQVGGVPMTLGKAAVPFGGGRVVSLFSHGKYDSVTIEYLDDKGGFHGAIFRLGKGQGETLRNALLAHGAHLGPSSQLAAEQSTAGDSVQPQEWSVQVDRVDPANTTLDPCFSDAIYENLLRELGKSKQFKQVFRSGDRTADDVSSVLVLKVLIEGYSPGSETKRAVTTFGGATKLKVRVQLVTRQGRVVMERAVQGNVRFMGDNLKATNKVASNTTKTLKGSPLPGPSTEPVPPSKTKSTVS